MTPLVSINLPCDRQLDLARRALETILEVTLLDDARRTSIGATSSRSATHG